MKKDLRQVTVAEVKTLQALSSTTFSETFATTNDPKELALYLKEAYALEKLTRELQDKDSYFYFAYLDDELAGYLKLNVNEAQTEQVAPNALEIERIYLKADFKRQGLGRFLLEHALKVAKEKHCSTVWLGVWEKNFPALAFYKKLGFAEQGAHSFFLGNEEQTDLIMVKRLEH